MCAFNLYITGRTARSQKAITDLKSFLESAFMNNHSLEIVDILENPDLGQKYNIIATPTAVKAHPPPLRKVIGDFSNKGELAACFR